MSKSLLVQSDRSILLDLHDEDAEKARNAIIPFSDLIKSPEHMHTYTISSLSIWNAISAGMTADEIIRRLKEHSRYEIDERVLFFIQDAASRYGAVEIRENDSSSCLLYAKTDKAALIIEKNKEIESLVEKTGERCFTFPLKERGSVKIALIKLGYPALDLIPMKKGEPLSVEIKDELEVRDYQKEAADIFLSGGSCGHGYGIVVLPCGSGKTILAILLMSRIKTRTLILAPNITSVHQWISEIKRWTNLTDDDVGEYSGEKKDIKKVTVSTYQIFTHKDKDEVFTHFEKIRKENWGFVIYDEVHMLPAPVFKITAEMQSIYRLGLTATLIREDGREDEVFSLVGPKRYDKPWSELEKKGFIAKAFCHEIRIPLAEEETMNYALASEREKYRIASVNKNKLDVIKKILERHGEDQKIIIGQYLSQLEEVRKAFSFPLITGSMSNKKRDELYAKFRNGEIKTLIVSKVANFAVDLPDCSVAIQISGTFGSRQEEAQRLGRILRPKERESHFYTIITEYSQEEEFALNRQKFLSEQGYSYDIIRYEE